MSHDLRATAIAAYEASKLKQEDLQKSEARLNRIRLFLEKFGIEDVTVNSNPFEIDELRLYADPTEDIDGLWGYRLTISRKCQRCNEDLIFEVTEDCNPALIGQWLSEIHPCEFEAGKCITGFGGNRNEH